jgi:putative mRNA 3-end processing factor
MAKLSFLGAVEEVGRSAILLEPNDGRGVLLDCGVQFNHTARFPVYVEPGRIQALAISHCHLDHVGGAPLFFIGGRRNAVSTKLTKELSAILLLDMLKISRGDLPFDSVEVSRFLSSLNVIENRERYRPDGTPISLEFFNAGHVIGASQIMANVDGLNVLYTGDMNMKSTRIVPAADTNYDREVNVLISESTYATTDHPPREAVEDKFVKAVKEVVESGGRVLIPAFGVGRSQEIITVLKAHGFSHRVMIDGMTKTVTEVLMSHLEYLNERKNFEDAVHDVIILQGNQDRKNATRDPGVIVTPAGMLKGGPSVKYSEEVARGKKNAIFLVSYQVEGTPGAVLLEKKVLPLGGKIVEVKARVEQFDFSSHNGRADYIELAKKTNPQTAFLVHGTKDNVNYLAQQLEEIGIPKVIKPALGETYNLS